MDTTEIQRMTEVEALSSRVPKFISPGVHAVLDYLTIATFMAAGFAWRRRHARASALAFINAAAVMGATLFCDYPGGVWRLFSFRTHARLDAMQASISAMGPALMGFGKDAEGQFFHGQAALESGIIATTNFSPA